ncbi:MAG: S8 family serine peptidase [Odoribacteraceae bacterium]|jgi:subtilisin family serine protease|nr:S8 family serine peptidase [Odoribacteraceae bacterium]
MRRYFLIWALCLGCQHQPLDFAPEPEAVHVAETLEGWARVKLCDTLPRAISRAGGVETGIPDLDQVARAYGATRVERVFSDGGKFRERRRAAGLHLWYDFYFGTSQPITRAISDLSDLPFVEVVERIPVFRRQSSSAPQLFPRPPATRDGEPDYPFDDPELHRQHHYQNFGLLPNSVPGADINLFAAWNVTRGDPGIVVAVIDDGIDIHHPDLAANIWVNEAERDGAPGVDDDGNGYIDDIYGWRFDYFSVSDTLWGGGEIIPMDHGTHCAGIIAAVNNNGIGGCGVAGGGGLGDGARLMSCQTFVPDSTGDPFSDSRSGRKADEAWLYAADNGAIIASCSFSSESLSASYQAALDYFIENAGVALDGSQYAPMRGGIVICAAGNYANEIPRYPGAYARCLSVAYVTSNFVISSNASYGDWVNLVAPGGSSSSTFGSGGIGGVFSTIATGSTNGISDGYGYKSGSSMATPHVAGIAALVIAKFGSPQPGFIADSLKARLLRGVRPVEQYNLPKYHGKMGTGLVDALLALKSDEGRRPETPPLPEVSWRTNSVDIGWVVTRDQNYLPAARFQVFWSLSSLQGFDPEAPGEGVNVITLENSLAVGDTLRATIGDIPERTQYYLSVVAVDEYGNYSLPRFFAGRTLDNTAPTRRTDVPFQFYFERHEPLTIDLANYFSDTADDSLRYAAVSTDVEVLFVSLAGGSRLTFRPVADGFCRVRVSATDNFGARAYAEFVIMVRASTLDADFYPNPVVDSLHVRMGKEVEGQKRVRVYNSVGVKVLDAIVFVRPFAPGALDLSALSGGAYIVVLEHNNKEIRQGIVKY